MKKKVQKFHIIFGIFKGLVEDVFLYADEKLAETKYNALKKYYGIKEEDDYSENEVKWFETPLIRRKVSKNENSSLFCE